MIHGNRMFMECGDCDEHELPEPVRLYTKACPFIYALTTIALGFGIYAFYANSGRYLFGLLASMLIFFFASKIFTNKLNFNGAKSINDSKIKVEVELKQL